MALLLGVQRSMRNPKMKLYGVMNDFSFAGMNVINLLYVTVDFRFC